MLKAVRKTDSVVTKFFAERQRPLLVNLMTDFSALSSPVNVLTFVLLSSLIDLRLAFHLATGTALTWITVYALKFAISRERPEGNLETYLTTSFPSAHSATAFLFVGLFPTETRALLYPIALAVSFSRIYLQSHYL